MDEMTLLRRLRSGIPAAEVTREAEEAFISRITAEAANLPTVTHPAAARRITAPLRRFRPVLPGGRGWRRLAVRDFAWRLSEMGGGCRWRLVVAAGVSVALAIGVIAGVGHGAGSPGPPASGSRGPARRQGRRCGSGAALRPARPVDLYQDRE